MTALTDIFETFVGRGLDQCNMRETEKKRNSRKKRRCIVGRQFVIRKRLQFASLFWCHSHRCLCPPTCFHNSRLYTLFRVQCASPDTLDVHLSRCGFGHSSHGSFCAEFECLFPVWKPNDLHVQN